MQIFHLLLKASRHVLVLFCLAIGVFLCFSSKIHGTGKNWKSPNNSDSVIEMETAEIGTPSYLFPGVILPSDPVPISVELKRLDSDGSVQVMVEICNLNRDLYFRDPASLPMFRDRRNLEECQATKHWKSLEDLNSEKDAQREIYIEPTGFIFHVGRCGSTLLANMLASIPRNIVFSEPHATSAIFSECKRVRCSDKELEAILKDLLALMGKTSHNETANLFIKFQSGSVLLGAFDIIRRIYPNVPWIGVIRDPLPVLQSFLGTKEGSKGASCTRTRSNPPVQILKTLGISSANEARRIPEEAYCAAHVSSIMQTFMSAIKSEENFFDRQRFGHILLYENIHEDFPKVVEDHFNVTLSGIDRYSMWNTGKIYSKGRYYQRSFLGDTEEKESSASVLIRKSAEKIAPIFEEAKLLSELAFGRSSLALNTSQFDDHLKGLKQTISLHEPDFMSPRSFSSPKESFDCPLQPPKGYPKEWPILDIILNWNPENSSYIPATHYLSICRFDYQDANDRIKADMYKKAEKPYILFNIPLLDESAEQWQNPTYLSHKLGSKKYRAEVSTNNHFLYYNTNPTNKRLSIPSSWQPPTYQTMQTYDEWLFKALSDHEADTEEHWYLKITDFEANFISDNLSFVEDIFFDGKGNGRGINCRFGMHGVIAEAHFDGNRNAVFMLSGKRRWILSHPKNCIGMYLRPIEHPSGRHSRVNWSDPDLSKYPQFGTVTGNEVILKAGEVLHLPAFWFHYIVNLGINAQCNTRGSVSKVYKHEIKLCGAV